MIDSFLALLDRHVVLFLVLSCIGAILSLAFGWRYIGRVYLDL